MPPLTLPVFSLIRAEKNHFEEKKHLDHQDQSMFVDLSTVHACSDPFKVAFVIGHSDLAAEDFTSMTNKGPTAQSVIDLIHASIQYPSRKQHSHCNMLQGCAEVLPSKQSC